MAAFILIALGYIGLLLAFGWPALVVGAGHIAAMFAAQRRR